MMSCPAPISDDPSKLLPDLSKKSFPGIDLLPHRAASAFSTSSELLLDLQVGFAHVVFWKDESFK